MNARRTIAKNTLRCAVRWLTNPQRYRLDALRNASPNIDLVEQGLDRCVEIGLSG
jgi:hypothetical protein